MARLVVLFVCALGALNATSQDLPVTVLPSPNVDLTQAGAIRSVLRQPDGNWLVAGNYQRLGAVRRPGLGRLAADGSVDTSFQPVTSLSPSNIRQIVSRDDGSSLVLHINLVQRLLSNGTVDPTFSSLLFNPTFANSIVVVSDGFIVGGNFTQVLTSPATTVQRLAKFGFDGSLISTFSVGVNSNIRVMQATGPDEIIVGGIFTQAGGQARTGLARISTSGAGALVADWNPVLTRSGGSVSIEDIAVVGNDVFITGLFDTVNGATRTRVAKLGLTTGVVDPVWNVAVTGGQTALLRVIPHNTSVILSSGQPQTFANPPAAGISRRAARIDRTSGIIDTGFDPAMFSESVPIFTATDGDSPTRLLIAGNFVQVDAVQRFALAQLDAAGRLDLQSGHVEAISPGTVSNVVFDPVSRRTYLSGTFLRAGVAERRYILRLSPSGVVDTAWRAQTDDRQRPAMAVVSGQGVYVAANAGIFRLNETDGNQIAGWTNPFVANELVAGNGALYALGSSQLLRLPLAGNGTADPGFVAEIGSSTSDLAFDPVGNTLLVSTFVTLPGGGTQRKLVRLDALTGARLPAFDPLFETTSVVGPQGFAVDGDGVWVAGNFTRVNGVTRASPVRLRLSDGQIDPNTAATVGTAFNNGLGFHRGFFYGFAVTSGGATEVRRVPSTGGAIDSTWALPVNGVVDSMAFDGLRLLVGGSFDRLGAPNVDRFGIAAVLEAERIMADSFEGN